MFGPLANQKSSPFTRRHKHRAQLNPQPPKPISSQLTTRAHLYRFGAAAALVAIQISIGVLYKIVQHEGQYVYLEKEPPTPPCPEQLSLGALSSRHLRVQLRTAPDELLLICALSFNANSYAFSPSSSLTISELLKFWLSTWFFYREIRRRHAASGSGYAPLPQPSSSSRSGNSSDDESEKGASSPAPRSRAADLPSVPLTARTFVRYCWAEMSTDLRFRFAQLALFYALINNTVGFRWIAGSFCSWGFLC